MVEMTVMPTSDSARLTLVLPPAPPARLRRRHLGIFVSFLILVAIPSLVVAGYLFTRAAEQFASSVAFSVRAESVPSPVEFFGGLADFAGSGTQDSDILNAFIQSQDMVERLEASLGLSRVFALPENDPVFAFDPVGTIEDLHEYWQRMVRVLHDPATGLIEVRVLAFAADDAQDIATGILSESAALVEELSAIAQDDTTEFARAELARAETRLRGARQQLTAFRSRTQIVDPSADLQGQMGLLATLERELATAMIDTDMLRQNTRADDIRLSQADRRIAIIERRIADERRNLGVGIGPDGDSADYANVISEFERLAMNREFASQSYTAAMMAFDLAQAEARRKSRYLAAHIRPTRAQSAQYPRRLTLFGVTAFFLVAAWATGALIFYSLRDRR